MILDVPPLPSFKMSSNPSPNRRMWRVWFVAAALGCLLCVGCLYIVLSSAFHSVNESLCTSNLAKLHRALIDYDAVNGSLPPAWISDEDGTPMHSWRILILPYLDSWGIDGQTISARYNFDESWDGKANRSLIKPVAESRFACPCGPEDWTTLTSYVVPVGPTTLFPGAKGLALSDIPGECDPILVLEITNSDIHWAEPRDLDIDRARVSDKTNSFNLTLSHGRTIRYATVKGRFGTLQDGTDYEKLLKMCQSGIPPDVEERTEEREPE